MTPVRAAGRARGAEASGLRLGAQLGGRDGAPGAACGRWRPRPASVLSRRGFQRGGGARPAVARCGACARPRAVRVDAERRPEGGVPAPVPRPALARLASSPGGRRAVPRDRRAWPSLLRPYAARREVEAREHHGRRPWSAAARGLPRPRRAASTPAPVRRASIRTCGCASTRHAPARDHVRDSTERGGLMAGGAYVALSGMRTRLEELDRLAADIANARHAGYKAERGTTSSGRAPGFDACCESAIDVADGARQDRLPQRRDDADRPRPGRRHRGPRASSWSRRRRPALHAQRPLRRGADGMLVTEDGKPVLGENGPIKLRRPARSDRRRRHGPGRNDGRGQAPDRRVRRTDRRSSARAGRVPRRPTPRRRQPKASGAPRRRARAVERLDGRADGGPDRGPRTFEALQKGVSVLMNDIDGRAITELGRR